MNLLSAPWVPWVLDGLIVLILFGFFTQGVRRGLIELTLTSVLFVCAVIASLAVSYVEPYVPAFPFRFLALAALPLLVYLLVLFGSKSLLKHQLQQLDERDVPLWDALPGGLLGLARGLVVVILLGLAVSIPAQLTGQRLIIAAPASWALIAPVREPIEVPFTRWLVTEIQTTQAAQGQANELGALINQLVSEEALGAIFGDLGKSTIENAAKKKETQSQADKILGN